MVKKSPFSPFCIHESGVVGGDDDYDSICSLLRMGDYDNAKNFSCPRNARWKIFQLACD